MEYSTTIQLLFVLDMEPAMEQCVCNDGYIGRECEKVEVYCFGVSETDGNVCSGKGKCTDVDKCV